MGEAEPATRHPSRGVRRGPLPSPAVRERVQTSRWRALAAGAIVAVALALLAGSDAAVRLVERAAGEGPLAEAARAWNQAVRATGLTQLHDRLHQALMALRRVHFDGSEHDPAQ